MLLIYLYLLFHFSKNEQIFFTFIKRYFIIHAIRVFQGLERRTPKINYKIDTIFFGGGTPSLIPPNNIKYLIAQTIVVISLFMLTRIFWKNGMKQYESAQSYTGPVI